MADPIHVLVVLDPITTKLQLIASPFRGVVDREIQEIRWLLAVPGFFWPAEGGVRFVDPPPSGFDPWPGDTPTLNAKTNQYEANVRLAIEPGQPRQMYKYDIFLLNSAGETHVISSNANAAANIAEFGEENVDVVDPDIQNDPLP